MMEGVTIWLCEPSPQSPVQDLRVLQDAMTNSWSVSMYGEMGKALVGAGR